MAGPMPVFATDETVVTVMGNIATPPGPGAFSAHLGALARGPAGALTGTGFDAPPIGSGASGAPGNPGFCVFPLTGSVSADVVTLSGAVKQSSVKALIGFPVSVNADTSTGSITLMIGPFTLTGTGSVTIHS
jgi:hypothetical protein